MLHNSREKALILVKFGLLYPSTFWQDHCLSSYITSVWITLQPVVTITDNNDSNDYILSLDILVTENEILEMPFLKFAYHFVPYNPINITAGLMVVRKHVLSWLLYYLCLLPEMCSTSAWIILIHWCAWHEIQTREIADHIKGHPSQTLQ